MAIAQVGGAHNSAASAATIAATYSPTAGNIVIVFVATGGAVTAISVQDNNGNYLAPGPTGSGTLQVAAGTGQLYAFWGIASSGATSYTANWTTSQVSAITVEEYSGVLGVYFLTATSGYFNTGTSTTAALTLHTVDPNDWLVGGVANNSTDAFTSIAATNLRQNSGTGQTIVCALLDSGAVSSVNTNQTVQATVAASVAWGGLAFILRPFAGAPYNASTNVTGSTASPLAMNAILYGLQLIKNPTPGSGSVTTSGVVYGNSPVTPIYVPYGQMYP